MSRVLHLLSQRPSLTGSGITLDALVRHAAEAGWEQRVVAGVPASDPYPEVGGLDREHVLPLRFEHGELPFAVPGMSDVMPYPSTRFSCMDGVMLARYRGAWRNHLQRVIREFQPQLIHSHHLWIMSSMLAEIAPGIPVLNHCHATGLRQMELCPHLADEVRTGCSSNAAFAVLHRMHRDELGRVLEVAPERIHVVGAGYRETLFHARDRELPAPRLVYIGKLSASKGLPQLLDAFEALAPARAGLELHVAGSGAGAEAETLAARLTAMAPQVVYHGQLNQTQLADLMRRATVCVLPSFYEGLPLVLVEALACGCRLVATALPGIVDELAPHLGAALETVPMPAMASIDQPRPEALPHFTAELRDAIERSLDRRPITDPVAELGNALASFTWRAVFQRVETVWRGLMRV